MYLSNGTNNPSQILIVVIFEEVSTKSSIESLKFG